MAGLDPAIHVFTQKASGGRKPAVFASYVDDGI
jgi:hypothetical protein